MLGRLGADRLRQQGRDWRAFPTADPRSAHYFSTTGHAIAPQFWEYWRGHGLDLGDPGISERELLALFGFPLSEPAMETNEAGDTVLTQWFERARFEHHPRNPAPYTTLLGLLGNEVRAHTPRQVTNAAIGAASVGGDRLVWAEGNGEPSPRVTRFGIRNLRTGMQSWLPAGDVDRGAPTTDGTTVVWTEWGPGPNRRIMGHDLDSGRTFTIAGTQGYYGVVAEEDGAVVGFALGYTERWQASYHFFLKEMCVAPARQRSGIGTALMEALAHDIAVRRLRSYICSPRVTARPPRSTPDVDGISGTKTIMMAKYLH